MKTSILLVLGALTVGGCASSRTAEQPATGTGEPERPEARQQPAMRGGMMSGDTAGMCPMAVEGTTARAEEVEGGAALVFTTTGDVGELRRRVARMAEMPRFQEGDRRGGGMGMHGGMGMRGGSGTMGGKMRMPPATARSEEIEGGARLVLTARDPADLTALREHVRQHSEMMASGRCPMMSTEGQGAEGAPPPAPSEHESHHPESGK